MRFHGFDVLDESGEIYQSGPLISRHEGEPVRLRLWWSVDQRLEYDYSVGTYLMFGQKVLSQVDGSPSVVTLEYPPNLPPAETSRWVPGQYYIEERELNLPYEPHSGTIRYRIWLSVYQWWDNTRINAPGMSEDKLLQLQIIFAETW